MNKQELIEKYKTKGEVCKEFPVVAISDVLKDLRELDEPEQVTIPQFVADWIEECKNDDFHLFGAMEAISLNQKKLDYWFREDDNMELFARAWLDGYEVEKEPKYTVRVKGIIGYTTHLNKNLDNQNWFFASENEVDGYRVQHTRKELEEAGFGEVFNSPLFEVEEVTE